MFYFVLFSYVFGERPYELSNPLIHFPVSTIASWPDWSQEVGAQPSSSKWIARTQLLQPSWLPPGLYSQDCHWSGGRAGYWTAALFSYIFFFLYLDDDALTHSLKIFSKKKSCLIRSLQIAFKQIIRILKVCSYLKAWNITIELL